MEPCSRPIVVTFLTAAAAVLLGMAGAPRSAELEPEPVQPELGKWLGSIPTKLDSYDVVAVPDRDEPEWWAGAPSVMRDDDGTFWMAARMRTADAPLGKRGYEIRILQSRDGIRFEKARSVLREDVAIEGFERPALLKDPRTRRFKLYGCGPLGGTWCVFKFDDADRPDQFIASTARPVIVPPKPSESRPAHTIVGRYRRGPALPRGYKDPVIFHTEGCYHCYVIGQLGTERLFHFVSEDGGEFEPVGHPSDSLLPLHGWHSFCVRPASVVPLGVGYLFVYEGSDTRWADPVYNIATGLGFTFDLHHVVDLTPDGPLAISTTPGRLHTWRYSHWLWVGSELWIYAEVEKANGAHEIRLFRLPVAPGN